MRAPLFLALLIPCLSFEVAAAARLHGVVVDQATNRPLASRVYLRNAAGQYFHVQCPEGNAITYNVRRSETSFEHHTTVSAHSFHADLAAGDYTLVVERGKEYFTQSREITIADGETKSITVPLRRWTDMAAQGWFSGETHVHREVAELPLLQLAEDLNVAFPLTAWVTDSEHTPAADNKNRSRVPPAKLISIDSTHVFWPVNTEYEIFTVRGLRHTLGAVFILNHQEQFALAAPPVGPIAEEARRQGAFLELDKHNWPWSMMLLPKMRVDLFELTNNHLWRTNFFYSHWYPEYAASYMQIEMSNGQFTERGWIDFGFQTYYALLNCGFDMKPTAGTASGVHPVPLGYGRVYVKIDGAFSYAKWVEGLLAGRSFVTTGPMLLVSVEDGGEGKAEVDGYLESATAPEKVDIIVNGDVAATIDTQPQRTDAGAFRVPIDTTLTLRGPSWVAARALVKRPGGRISFAHTAPVPIQATGQPLRPTGAQRDYLAKRVSDEISRNRRVLSDEAMEEYQSALRAFESLPVRQ